jgi:hypothetical protein
MSIPNGYRVSVGDDPDYEDLTAEIYYQETFLAMLTQEQGFEKLQLNIYTSPSGDAWTFAMNDFLLVVEHAKQRLWDLRRVD